MQPKQVLQQHFSKSISLVAEVKQFGISVTLLEPNGYSTDCGATSAIRTKAMSEHDQIKADFQKALTDDFFGHPAATVEAILKLVDAEILHCACC